MELLSPKQMDCYHAADGRWNILYGATGSGKTVLSHYLKAKRMRQLPAGNCLLVGKTERTYKRNVLDPLRLIFGEELVSQVHGDGQVELFGRPCYLVGANDERAIQKIQGISLVYADLDEGATYPESFIQMLKSRLREPGACCDMTMNPEGPYHYIKTGFIDRAQEIGARVFHFTLDDNPFLPPEFVDSIKREYPAGSVWYRRYILGEWAAAEGAIYDMLDETAHVVDEVPSCTRYIVGVDYGTGSVTTFWLLGIGADNRLYFIDRYRWDASERRAQRTDLQFVQDLETWLAGLNVTADIVVPGDAQSFMVQLKQVRGNLPHVSSIAWADRSPGSVLDGIRDVATLLEQRRLLFSRKLQRSNALGEWVGYVWDAKAQQRGEDQPLKANDHDPDAGRYAITYAKRFWLRSLREAA